MRPFDAVFKKQRHVPIEEIMLNYGGEQRMTNFEKYKDEIKEIFKEGSTCGIRNFIEHNIEHNKDHCILDCHVCRKSIIEWLESEYKEPEVDWNKVEVDTKILVSDDGVTWKNRYFARNEGERIFFFAGGATSWSSNKYDIVPCEYAKLVVEGGKEDNNG